jgi:hypothetical protein
MKISTRFICGEILEIKAETVDSTIINTVYNHVQASEAIESLREVICDLEVYLATSKSAVMPRGRL